MLVQQGEERSNDVDRKLACCLAAVAGALNAAAFRAVGLFSANMTGNVSAFSEHIARGDLAAAAFFLAIVVTFVAGAALSTILINLGRRRHIHAIYAYSILVEAFLLTFLAIVNPLLSATVRGPALVLGLAFLMGLQNAVVTRISNTRVRTTHVSGMATDIGIEIAMLIEIARGRLSPAEAASYRSKLSLHAATILAFVCGGILGVLVYQMIGTVMLLAAAIFLFGIAFTGVRAARRLEVG